MNATLQWLLENQFSLIHHYEFAYQMDLMWESLSMPGHPGKHPRRCAFWYIQIQEVEVQLKMQKEWARIPESSLAPTA